MTEKWWEAAPVVEEKAEWWSAAPLAEPDYTTAEKLRFAPAGVNVGLANVLGAPVDVANALVGRVRGAMQPGHVPGQAPRSMAAAEPALGSAHLRRLLTEMGAGYQSLEELPSSVRPLARAGEVVGESLPFAAAPLAAARTGAKGGMLTRPMLEAARRNPGAFAATEMGGAVGAGMGAGAAETLFPGSRAAGMAGEVAGGVLSPVGRLTSAVRTANDSFRRISSTLSKSGRQSQAAKSLSEAIVSAGEDPAMLASGLGAPGDVPGLDLTSAQKTASTALTGLEQKLARDIPELGNRLRERLRRTTEGFNRAYASAVEGGDSALLRTVSQERARWFSSLVEARVSAAEKRAFDETVGLRPTKGRGEAGQTARGILEDALGDAREAERALWGDVPRDVQVPTDSLTGSYNVSREALLAEEALPAPVEAFMARVRNSPESINSGELLRFRSRLLAMQRNMRSSMNPDWTVHRALGDLASGALDDLAGVPGTDDARAFSYQLNNLFSRGEVGKLMGFEPAGGGRIPPEMTLERGIGAGGTRGAVASRQMEQAAQLEGLPGDLTRRTTLPEQEEFIRNLATRAIDERTGRINPKALDSFKRENRELLRQFPDLTMQLGSAADAQALVQTARKMQQQAQKAVQQRASFARVAQVEDPAQAVGAVLRGSNPLQEYNQLAKLARRDGAETLGGLRKATFDYLFSQATTPQGLISGRRIREILTRKPTDKTPNLLQSMESTGVVTPEQRRNLMRVVDEAEKVEGVIASGARIGEVMADVNALEDLLTRVIGANIGGAGTVGQISGAPLVAAQAGSSFARQLTQKIPVARTQEMLAQAVEDPQFMAALLNRSPNPRQKKDLARQINGWLLQTGIPGSDQGNDQE